MSDTILAFDVGTTGNKAVIVDAQSATPIAWSSADYPTFYTEDGGAEQRPLDWWLSAIQCCKELAAAVPLQFSRIGAIGCTGMMNGVVLANERGEEIHNAIIHADVRSGAVCAQTEKRLGRERVFAATSNRLDPHLSLPKAAWLASVDSGLLDRTKYIIQAKDYLTGRLSGRFGITDPSDASLTGGFDVANRKWVKDLWHECGVSTRLLPTVLPSTTVLGGITSEAASATGIRQGVPIVVGGGDGACASAGSGCAMSQAYLCLGSTAWIGRIEPRPLMEMRLSNYCCLDEHVTSFGTVQAAGSALSWICSLLGRSGDYEALDAVAAQVPAGAMNLFFLPYLQGERSPLWDSKARGVFFGLASHHDQATVYRAVLEGVGFALKSIADIFGEHDRPIAKLRLLGGGGFSDLWKTIICDMLGSTIEPLQHQSWATSLGAAIAAGVGTGMYPSLQHGITLFKPLPPQVPELESTLGYSRRYKVYETLYPALKDSFSLIGDLK